MSGFEAQARILHQSNQIRDEIKSLYNWEQDMKNMEAKRTAVPDAEAFDHRFPLRNQMQASKPSSSSSSSSSSSFNSQPSTSSTASKLVTDVTKRKPTTAPPNAIEKANEFKTRGNDCVKNGQHEKAVKYYTEAINLNKSDPVFYTNRALCYLKQSKFNECIDDCTKAIGLDGKAVKAYYRRMQAREQMPDGDLKLAWADCKTVLQIDPKNGDAQRGLDRLLKLMKGTPTTTKVTAAATAVAKAKTPELLTATATTKRERSTKEPNVPTQALWSQYDGKNGYERIDFVTKAPHLRSKEPLKRIAIGSGDQKITVVPAAVEPKQSDDGNKTTPTTTKPTPPSTPTTPHIDQTNATVKSIASQQKPTSVQPMVIPKNAAQFNRTWISLSDDAQKFTVLKGIYDADIAKLLGAQFNLDTLREIFVVLKSHFIHQNLPIANILSGIVKNTQMTIVSLMMNAADRSAFTEMVEYMRVRGEDAKQIDAIQKTFENLLSE